MASARLAPCARCPWRDRGTAGPDLSKLEAVYDEIEAAGHPQPAICPLNLETAVEKDYGDL